MRQQQERLEQMRQQQELVLQQVLEQLQELGLLFYRKQRERRQLGESPTGAILSCQFSLNG